MKCRGAQANQGFENAPAFLLPRATRIIIASFCAFRIHTFVHALMTEPLSRAIGALLRQQHKTLALAESCTGGLIASLLTDVPGSSEYFLGSVVAYAYEAKERLLDVPHELLLQHGAVSEAVTRVLALNARAKFGADVAIGITGIMGPGGATPTKPLGLTYIALSAPDASWCRRFVWNGDRLQNKADSAHAALEMLHEYLTR
jgi:PncC family amidohydrolase